jgi:hypothetical protein
MPGVVTTGVGIAGVGDVALESARSVATVGVAMVVLGTERIVSAGSGTVG